MLSEAKFRQSLFLKYGKAEQKTGLRILIRYRQNRDDLIQEILDYFARPVEGLHYPSKGLCCGDHLRPLVGILLWPQFLAVSFRPRTFLRECALFFCPTLTVGKSPGFTIYLWKNLSAKNFFPTLRCN